MSGHTPGPWTWEPSETQEGTRYQHVRSGFRGIADTYHADPITVLGYGPLAGHVEARHGNPDDARLIAAAPDLLEALERIIKEATGHTLASLDQARAAIAKARGGR